MSGISTHILDTANGRPLAGVKVRLSFGDRTIGTGTTDQDGRIRALAPEGTTLAPGHYQLLFETGEYFPHGFYPAVTITFTVRDESGHYHIPLLISPFGYTTYRGS